MMLHINFLGCTLVNQCVLFFKQHEKTMKMKNSMLSFTVYALVLYLNCIDTFSRFQLYLVLKKHLLLFLNIILAFEYLGNYTELDQNLDLK